MDLQEELEKYVKTNPNNRMAVAKVNWLKRWSNLKDRPTRDNICLMLKYCILDIYYRADGGAIKNVKVTSNKALIDAMNDNRQENDKKKSVVNLHTGEFINPGKSDRKIRTFDVEKNSYIVITLNNINILPSITIPNKFMDTEDKLVFTNIVRELCGKEPLKINS